MAARFHHAPLGRSHPSAIRGRGVQHANQGASMTLAQRIREIPCKVSNEPLLGGAPTYYRQGFRAALEAAARLAAEQEAVPSEVKEAADRVRQYVRDSES